MIDSTCFDFDNYMIN